MMINAVLLHRLNESEKKSVSFELKKLFRCLESNKGSATTNKVTNALGIRNGKLVIMYSLIFMSLYMSYWYTCKTLPKNPT